MSGEAVPRAWWCAAFVNEDFICIETYSGYRSSQHDPRGAEHFLNPDASDHELGEAVFDALKHSRFVLPREDPELYDYKLAKERYSDWVASLMARYAYKTKRALFKNMKYCNIKSEGGVITIRPTYHEKLEAWSGDGISKDDYVVLPATSSEANIGAALRLALSRCV